LAAAVLGAILEDWTVKPDFLLILLVFFSIHFGPRDAIITSFTIGFAADLIVFGAGMGPRMISFGLFGTALAFLGQALRIRKMVFEAAAIFVLGLLTGLLAHLLGLVQGQTTAPNIYTAVLGTSLYSAVVGPFLFLPIKRAMRIKKQRVGRG
jgi:rod shape-determining protein MreD